MSWLKRNGTRYLVLRHYQEIDGWLSLDEAITLYEISKSLPGDGPVIVELGVWQGKSVFVLAQGIKDKPRGKIYCVDPFNADSSPDESTIYLEYSRNYQVPLKERFEDICGRYGIASQIEVLEGYSYEFSPSWRRPIDLLFIDANHTYEAVYHDFEEWSGFIREGGFVIFHYVDFEEAGDHWKGGPARFVRRHLLTDDRFVMHRFVDSIFAVKRVSPAHAKSSE